uniref:Uncharacterized protein n=1 Tax=Burkholderia sp. M701 TaxID=326454 RepID=V5YNE4_9BURK|nr:hypothetical protein [Burkholderia sp. M701]
MRSHKSAPVLRVESKSGSKKIASSYPFVFGSVSRCRDRAVNHYAHPAISLCVVDLSVFPLLPGKRSSRRSGK